MRRQLIEDDEAKIKITFMKGWHLSGRSIKKEFKFKDFIEAVGFVGQIIEPAEKLNHHPDILIIYNRVTITLTTHDRNGLTDYDFQLAKLIDGLI